MSINLTEAAAHRVKEFLITQEASIGLRLDVKPSGCSGFTYVVNLAETIEDSDEVYESLGIKVVVNREKLPVLTGTTIDFQRVGLSEGFIYDNPNVAAECGCGESFSV